MYITIAVDLRYVTRFAKTGIMAHSKILSMMYCKINKLSAKNAIHKKLAMILQRP